MPTLSTLRHKTYSLMLTILAKLLRPITRVFSHLTGTPKPTPNSVEYIPVNTNNTTDRTIKLHIYNATPTSTLVGTQPSSPSPVLINTCGSGFVMPGLGIDTEYCRYIATTTGHTVIDVEYRLAPEHPFPAALEDIAAVISHVLSQPGKYDITRISIGGFSAGGNLATSAAVNYFPRGTFQNLIVFYPVLDGSICGYMKIASMPAEHRGRPAYGGMGSVPACVMQFFQACYISSVEGDLGETGLRDPRISPVYADLDRFPKRCLFVTAEFDCLAGEVEGLVKRLQAKRAREEGDTDIEIIKAVMCGHAFDKRATPGSEREKIKMEIYGRVAAFLNKKD
ncbi:Alpha/Beta hydrolase protein [Aspergillus heterothallicus]